MPCVFSTGIQPPLALLSKLVSATFKRAAEIQSDTINRYFAYTWQTCKVRMRMLACQPCEWECCHAEVFLAGSGGVLNQRTNHSTTPQKCSNASWMFWTPPSHSGSHAQHHTSQVADVYTKSSPADKSCQLLSSECSGPWSEPYLAAWKDFGQAWLCGTSHLLRAVSHIPCTLPGPMTRPNNTFEVISLKTTIPTLHIGVFIDINIIYVYICAFP